MKNFSKLNKKIIKNIMSENDNTLSALKRISLLKEKIILITKKNKLIGTVTDGDLRNSLFLNRSTYLKDIMNREPRVIKNGVKNFTKEDVFNFVNYLPVLDKSSNLIDLKKNDNNEIIKFSNHVVIFAGGMGKRLYPYTKKIPKPMLKIKNKPNLVTLIKKIRKSNFENITISIFYKNKYFKKKLKNQKINFYTEKKPLGTAGSLAKINYKNNLPVIAINADLISDLDIRNLMYYHNSSRSDFTISIKDRYFEIPFATVDVKNKKIFKLEEKPRKHYFFNTGIYMIKQDLIRMFIKKNEQIDMTDFIKRVLKNKYKVMPFYHHEKWIDYGTIKEYLKIK